MPVLKRIKQAIPEFSEQAQIVSDTYGGGQVPLDTKHGMVSCKIRSQAY